MKFSAGDRVRIAEEHLKPYQNFYPELLWGETLKVSKPEARPGGLVLWVQIERLAKNPDARCLCVRARHCVRAGGRLVDEVR